MSRESRTSRAQPARPRRTPGGGAAVVQGVVERMAAGGAGVVRVDRVRVLAAPPVAGALRVANESSTWVEGAGAAAVVLTHGVAPGERVEITEGRPGRLLRLLEASPDRVTPACEHVARCGGCDWMHLSAAAQVREHGRIVRDALAHALASTPKPLGADFAVRAHEAPRALAYRTRARLFVSCRGGMARVGYRAAGGRDLVAVDACAVLAPALAPLLADLAAVCAGARGEGDAHVALGAGGLPVVALAFRGELPAAAWGRLDERVRAKAWAGARVDLEGATQAATFGDPRPVLAGADGSPLITPAGGFAQPSDEAFGPLALRVADFATSGATPPRVLELFAGSGALSVMLARRAATFGALEIDPAAAAACRENLSARGLAGTVSVGDANATRVGAVDVIVLDPPRTGADGAVRAIAASRARTVVYVACDPPTLARDVATLAAAGFSVTDLETFELFPQTSHVETVARLARSR